MTFLYHYQADAVAIAAILRDGLRPLSDMPQHPKYESEAARFESRYDELARPHLKRPYHGNSGVFFTTIDLRRMTGRKRLSSTRLRIPPDRLDAAWSVLTFELDGQRNWLPLSDSNLELMADLWTDDLAQCWLGADNTGWFRYVPQVVSFQPGGVQVRTSDIDRAL
ncbi:MAG TPA: hypothetical protein VHC49_18010 [Mycobacteriales bacterium]|nr:hypothetical protein [Mycobacteriales bacterium]